MNEIIKVTFSIDWDLLKEFDILIEKKGLENRSKVIRNLIEDFIITEKMKENKLKKESKATYLLVLISNSPIKINTYGHLGITMKIEKDSYLTLVILDGTTYKEAESKMVEIQNNNSLNFCKLIQLVENSGE